MTRRGKTVAFQAKKVLLVIFLSWSAMTNAKINVHELKCEVCQRTVEEMEKDVDQVDPDKRINVGEFMLDYKGDRPQKTVELRKSEVYLTELMERVCKKMDDYVRAIMRDTGKLIVIPLIVNGMMNGIIGDAEIIQDGDLNKSLKFYCENIVEEYDEGFVKYFGTRVPDTSEKICWEYSNLCRETYPVEYEEDIVAAERGIHSKKKKNKSRKKRKPVLKDESQMTEQERIMDQISRLPITGPGIPTWDAEDDEDDQEASPQAATDASLESDDKAGPVETSKLNEAGDSIPISDPVLADSPAKDEL